MPYQISTKITTIVRKKFIRSRLCPIRANSIKIDSKKTLLGFYGTSDILLFDYLLLVSWSFGNRAKLFGGRKKIWFGLCFINYRIKKRNSRGFAKVHAIHGVARAYKGQSMQHGFNKRGPYGLHGSTGKSRSGYSYRDRAKSLWFEKTHEYVHGAENNPFRYRHLREMKKVNN